MGMRRNYEDAVLAVEKLMKRLELVEAAGSKLAETIRAHPDFTWPFKPHIRKALDHWDFTVGKPQPRGYNCCPKCGASMTKEGACVYCEYDVS